MSKLGDLFDVINGMPTTGLTVEDEPFQGSIKFIRPSKSYKGTLSGYVIKNTVNKNLIFPAETLFVSTNGQGSHSYSYVSSYEFCFNSDVAVLIPKRSMPLVEKLLYSKYITMNRPLFSYGRKPKGDRLKAIELPDLDCFPSWITGIDFKEYQTLRTPISKNKITLETGDWKEFTIDKLFTLKKGKRLTKANMTEGNTPFIAAIDKNNGRREFVGQSPIHEKNTITVNYNGSVAEAFYQDTPFWASDDVNVLYPKFVMNKFSAIFIIAIIRREKYRFNYGRKWHLERMAKSTLSLPVDKAGNLDTDYMERYIKTLPFSSGIHS